MSFFWLTMDPEKLDAATAAALGEGEEDDDVQGSPEQAVDTAETQAPTPTDADVITTEPDVVTDEVASVEEQKVEHPAGAPPAAAPISAGPVVGVVRLFGMPIEVSDKDISDFLQLGNLPESRILQICGLR